MCGYCSAYGERVTGYNIRGAKSSNFSLLMCSRAAGSGSQAVVRLLLESGADPHLVSFTWGKQVFGKGR